MNRIISKKELELNNGLNGRPLWINMNGRVYDVSNFKNNHPGGSKVFLENHASNKYQDFFLIHSLGAKRDAKNYIIGRLESSNDFKYKEYDETDDNAVMKVIIKSIIGLLIIFIILLY